jgi:UDP-glucose 4-epimerase
MRRALVTGGAGFIGTHLVEALQRDGYAVWVADDLSAGRADKLAGAIAAGAELERLDVRDPPALSAFAQRARPEVIFHLAAQVDVGVSVRDPSLDLRVNVEGTINVLEAAVAAGAPRVVLASTGGAIYGDGQSLPLAEDAGTAPLSPYGQSKLAAEGYCALYSRSHPVIPVALRFANVYGPGQEVRGEGAVVAAFCEQLVANRPGRVFGDGGQTRDFLYVADAVRAMILAASSSEPAVLNVGTGKETSVLDLGRCLWGLRGAVFEPQFEPARPGEVRRSALAADRAGEAMGWRPQTGLEEGLARTLEATRPPLG